MSKRWNSEETQILKDGYSFKGAEWVRGELQLRGFVRTIDSIYRKAQKLKIQIIVSAPRWSLIEEELIKEFFIGEGSISCQKKLLQRGYFRTINAIRNRASKLGIQRESGFRIRNTRIKLFGNWQSIEYNREESDRRGKSYYKCICKCSKVVFNSRGSLMCKNPIKSCGHCNDIVIGKMYGYLEPLCRGLDTRDSETGKHKSQYICECHFGALGCQKYTLVRAASLSAGTIVSCGCYVRELNRKRCQAQVKENNPAWKGGISDLANAIRTCDRNKYWKDFCRKRDNYICQKCDTEKGKFPVHHFKTPFWKMLERAVANGITNVNDIPDDSEFWDVDNGITLCEDCHKEFHSIYGYDFTKEDFEKWVGVKEY